MPSVLYQVACFLLYFPKRDQCSFLPLYGMINTCIEVSVVRVLCSGGLKAFHKDYSALCSQTGLSLARPVSCCRSPTSDGRIDDAQISEILPFLFVG